MSSPVDVSDRTKRQLEQLQAEIEAVTDREVSQREVLNRIVEQRYNSKDAFIDSFRDEAQSRSTVDTAALSEEEIEAFVSGTFASGLETGEEDIDEILYG